MPPQPKQPDGGFVIPNKGAASGSGSARKSIWDLAELENVTAIMVERGRSRQDLPRQLDPYDREQAITPPTLSKPEDQLKLPVKYFSKDPKAYREFQRGLFEAGYYGSKSWESIAGAALDETLTAWGKVLVATAQAQATGEPLTPADIIQRAIEGRRSALKDKPAEPVIRQHEDPHAVAGIIQQAAQASLGRNLSQAEVEHFVSEYRAAEDAYYRTAEHAAVTPGVSDLTKPDLQSRAEDFVTAGHGTEAAANDMSDYVGALENLLGGG